MWEKIAGAFAMIITIPMMVLIKGLGLPAFITVPLIIACTIIFLMGNVFLFNGGEIIKRPQRVKTASRVAPTELSLKTP
jgi:urea transporter